MAKELDVYRDWLGVQETTRPLNHYQILRLKQFEDDAAKIRSNYRKLNAHVRKYAAGEFSKQSQDLLNELAKAMLCLTDSRRKEEYDSGLGRVAAGQKRRYSLEQILVGRRTLTTDQLTKAKNYANSLNIELRDAVLQQKLADAETVMQAYAESIGLPYIDLNDLGVDLALVPQIPALVARQHYCAPVMVDDGTLLMASPNPLRPDIEEELRLRTGFPVRTVICTVGGIREAIDEYYPKSAAAAEAGQARPTPKTAAAEGDEDEEEALPTPSAASTGDAQAAKQTRLMITMVTLMVSAVAVYFLEGLMGMTGNLRIPLAAILGWVFAGIAYVLAGRLIR